MSADPSTVLGRLIEAPYLREKTLAGHGVEENIVLRAGHALEAAGLLDDTTADRDDAGRCTFCRAARGVPHTDMCAIPRCVITGHQRLVCRQRGNPGHDCGASLWAEDE